MDKITTKTSANNSDLQPNHQHYDDSEEKDPKPLVTLIFLVLIASFLAIYLNWNKIPFLSSKITLATVYISSKLYPIEKKISDDLAFPDLSVTIKAIGLIDKDSKNFTLASKFKSTDQIAVKFEVKNTGQKESGDWTFDAELPTKNQYILHSEKQTSLLPGDNIEFTIGFDNIKESGGEILLNLDPKNLIEEKSKENNIAKIKIDNVTF
jgi:hypothetical protein